MQAQLTTLRSLDAVSQQTPAVEIVKETAVKKKRTALKVTVIKVKLFFWNLSPLHWYDDFKVMKINLDEFMCKKTSPAAIDKNEEAGKQ
jgi:hypothetical protein